jgi:hypothetical protein
VAAFSGRRYAVEQPYIAVVAREYERRSYCRVNVAICQLGGT